MSSHPSPISQLGARVGPGFTHEQQSLDFRSRDFNLNALFAVNIINCAEGAGFPRGQYGPRIFGVGGAKNRAKTVVAFRGLFGENVADFNVTGHGNFTG